MENMRGAVLIVLSMLGFAIEDFMIKVISNQLPTGQILAALGVGGAVIFAWLCKRQNQQLWHHSMLTRPIVLRNLAELVGTMGFITAITLTPISTASAILQSTPLFVTLGAALIFREAVGWRRWGAIIIGFMGVLLIIRPGTEGFDHLSIITVIGALGLAGRDLATRSVTGETSSIQLSFLAFMTLIPTAFLLTWIMGDSWVMPSTFNWFMLVGVNIVAVAAYYAIVAAMRIGEISFVTPFRYTRLLFSLFFGVLLLGETPDRLTLIGATIIVSSGIYMIWRERQVKFK